MCVLRLMSATYGRGSSHANVHLVLFQEAWQQVGDAGRRFGLRRTAYIPFGSRGCAPGAHASNACTNSRITSGARRQPVTSWKDCRRPQEVVYRGSRPGESPGEPETGSGRLRACKNGCRRGLPNQATELPNSDLLRLEKSVMLT